MKVTSRHYDSLARSDDAKSKLLTALGRSDLRPQTMRRYRHHHCIATHQETTPSRPSLTTGRKTLLQSPKHATSDHNTQRCTAINAPITQTASAAITSSEGMPIASMRRRESCKQCRSGKRYGVYYNAAAHLRRAHFVPRKRGHKAKGEEKRGGIGGGDYPPIERLKSEGWLMEIEEQILPSTTQRSAADDDDTAVTQPEAYRQPIGSTRAADYGGEAAPTVLSADIDLSPVAHDATQFCDQDLFDFTSMQDVGDASSLQYDASSGSFMLDANVNAYPGDLDSAFASYHHLDDAAFAFDYSSFLFDLQQ
ncbi:hypothetical protein LTR60_000773 [Cryomyces antarcticus]|nr:hypothetical protein LTR60_000773 [Cryomyces antarcticus]